MLKEPLFPRFVSLAMICMFADSVPVAMLRLPGVVVPALELHLLLCLLLAMVIKYRYKDKNAHFPLLLLITTLGTGPLGAAICLLGACVYADCARSVSADWIEGFFAHENAGDNQILCERITLDMEDMSMGKSVEPFQDILLSGSVLEKQMVIAKITRYFRPQFAPLLQQAVQDVNAAVRVQAATALAKIERDFVMELMRLEKAVKATPAGSRDSQALRLKLAMLCDDYAHVGLLDQENQNALRTKAMTLYEEILTQGENADLRIRLARVCLRQNQPERTQQLLDGAVESGDISQNGLLWYMEALFRLKKLASVRQVSSRYAQVLQQYENYPFLKAIPPYVS